MFKSMTTNLMVEDVNRSISFYENILGFTVTVSVPNKKDGLQFAILDKDNLTLMVQERENLIEEYPTLNTIKVQPSITLYIKVENLDSLYIELKEKYKILCDLHTTFYGAKEFAIADSDGYVLTFTE